MVIFHSYVSSSLLCQLSLATKAAGASSHEALVSGGAVDAFGLLFNGHKKQEPNSNSGENSVVNSG